MTDEIGTDFSGAPDITPAQMRDAETLIRRLANRHGCKIAAGPDGKQVQDCPDPAAHTRDAADLSQPLQAIGALEYEPGLAPDQWGTRRHGDKRGRVQQ